MSSEQPKLNDSEAENKPTSGESETAPQTSDVVIQPVSAAPAPEIDDALTIHPSAMRLWTTS